MAFQAKKFAKAQFQARTSQVRVPGLAAFFDDGEEPLWTVRGLTACEMASVAEVSQRNQSLDAAVQAITSKQAEIERMREILGVADDVPVEVAKRIEQLIICSVEPVADRATVIKLAEVYPIEFYTLTNEIVRLTGLGMDLKKPAPSGETAASAA